jgi:hypothetical protein
VTAARFRLVLSGGTAAEALPRLARGVRVPPVLRRVSEFEVSEFALYAGGRVHQGELKAGFGATPDYYALDAPPDSAAGAIDPDTVLDLTGHLGVDGVLRWQAPPGRWRVLRFGASLTGQTNGPASPEATGLEVDKLDAEPVRRYFDTYLGLVGPGPLDALLSDSIEAGPQNWTGRMRERFAALRGYDPLAFLPTLAGYVVGDAASADRFLFDYRRTVSDLLASEYYGTIAGIARSRGLAYYAEALEDHRPQLGDDLAMRAQADVPMGAMWLFDPGSAAPSPTYVADLRGASSVAHVYGKAWTGAESMTAFHRPWSYTPRRLKHVADLELALGVTRFCIHTSPHQPVQAPPPGIGLAPFLGQVFVRTEPWAPFAGPWVDYLARCCYLLNQGLPAVDIAVFTGEEAPVTALYGDRLDDSVPGGFGFDYVGLEGLEDCLTVQDGVIVARGARYRVLYLGGSSHRMTLRALRRIGELLDDGATVVGARPGSSPSLADDPAEHARIVRALWDADQHGQPGSGPRRVRAVPPPDGARCELAADRPPDRRCRADLPGQPGTGTGRGHGPSRSTAGELESGDHAPGSPAAGRAAGVRWIRVPPRPGPARVGRAGRRRRRPATGTLGRSAGGSADARSVGAHVARAGSDRA